MKIELTCQYCDNKWRIGYNPSQPVYCNKCGDSNIKAIDLSVSKIDYYQGAPKFEDEDRWNK